MSRQPQAAMTNSEKQLRPGQLGRLTELDSLRCIAALSVVFSQGDNRTIVPPMAADRSFRPFCRFEIKLLFV
jgi:hypothetical protein